MSNPVVHFENRLPRNSRIRKLLLVLIRLGLGADGTCANTGSEQGIQGHYTALGHEPFHCTIFYVQADDIEAALAKANSLGGQTRVPKVDIPGYGAFAWFDDPGGNVVGLWKPASAA